MYNVTIIFCKSSETVLCTNCEIVKDPRESEYGKSQILAWH